MIPIKFILLYDDKPIYINPHAIISVREMKAPEHCIATVPNLPKKWTVIAVPGEIYEVNHTIEEVLAKLAGKVI
jgi:hypothetical protein